MDHKNGTVIYVRDSSAYVPCRGFTVLSLTFRYLIYLELIFVYGVKE